MRIDQIHVVRGTCMAQTLENVNREGLQAKPIYVRRLIMSVSSIVITTGDFGAKGTGFASRIGIYLLRNLGVLFCIDVNQETIMPTRKQATMSRETMR